MTGFIGAVFGASGEARDGAPAEMRIGHSIILASDGGGMRDAPRDCARSLGHVWQIATHYSRLIIGLYFALHSAHQTKPE